MRDTGDRRGACESEPVEISEYVSRGSWASTIQCKIPVLDPIKRLLIINGG